MQNVANLCLNATGLHSRCNYWMILEKKLYVLCDHYIYGRQSLPHMANPFDPFDDAASYILLMGIWKRQGYWNEYYEMPLRHDNSSVYKINWICLCAGLKDYMSTGFLLDKPTRKHNNIIVHILLRSFDLGRMSSFVLWLRPIHLYFHGAVTR